MKNSTQNLCEASVLIVCYKSKAFILNALSGLFEHTDGVDFEVLLTDCSQDGTEELVAVAYPQVRIISTNENLGFAKGNNFLAKHAKGKRLLLLNPDVLLHDNAIGALFQCSERFPDTGAWGGITLLSNGRIDPSCQQTIPYLGRLTMIIFGMATKVVGGVKIDATEPSRVEGLSGAFMMIDRQMWNDLGGFDETFFMYAEELDLCYRLQKQGKELIMTPNATLTHLVGSGSAVNPKRTLSITKAKMHFFWKHFHPFYAMLCGVCLWIHALSRSIGGFCMQCFGSKRHGALAASHWPLVCSPSGWWMGYRDRNS
jgi:N-acetylglucosaminyl-diphospho-decaprenol L-rhamnosyltransferase